MIHKGLPDEQTARLSPDAVQQYAESRGWLRVEPGKDPVVVYRHPTSDLDQLLIPLMLDYDDFGRCMAEVIIRLAREENRAALEVFQDLLWQSICGEQILVGFVEEVHEPTNDNGRCHGEVIVYILSVQKDTIRVHVDLEDEGYSQASEAHR